MNEIHPKYTKYTFLKTEYKRKMGEINSASNQGARIKFLLH